MSVIQLLAVVAFGTAVASAAGKCPVWVAVILLSLIVLLQVWR